MHIVIVAGIIVCAVADEIVLVHPAHGSDVAFMAVLGGPACYLLGAAWFKWLTLIFAVVACWETVALSAKREASAITH